MLTPPRSSAFLKNVYSVYRLSPNASVGLADLNRDSLNEYYPYPLMPASTGRVRGGGGPFELPSAPSGSGSAKATDRRQESHGDLESSALSVQSSWLCVWTVVSGAASALILSL